MEPDIGVFGLRQLGPPKIVLTLFNKSPCSYCVSKVIFDNHNVLKTEAWMNWQEGIISRAFPTDTCKIMVRSGDIHDPDELEMSIVIRDVDELPFQEQYISHALEKKGIDFILMDYDNNGNRVIPGFPLPERQDLCSSMVPQSENALNKEDVTQKHLNSPPKPSIGITSNDSSRVRSSSCQSFHNWLSPTNSVNDQRRLSVSIPRPLELDLLTTATGIEQASRSIDSTRDPDNPSSPVRRRIQPPAGEK